MNHFVRFRTALRLVVLAGIVTVFLLMTLPGYPAIVQDKEAPEGLTGGEEVQATSDILEGTWALFAVHTGKSGGWKHSGTITITKFEGRDGLQVKFDMGGSDPEAKNEVKFAGNAVILYRTITKSDGTDPDYPDSVDTSQTWRGRLLSDDKGLKIEGRISGGGTPWNIRHGNAVTFLARKQ
jgi:hypothetical protein